MQSSAPTYLENESLSLLYRACDNNTTAVCQNIEFWHTAVVFAQMARVLSEWFGNLRNLFVFLICGELHEVGFYKAVEVAVHNRVHI